MGVFDKRVSFKPFEYPEITKFKEAINHSYWLVSEWNFMSDVHDFKSKLTFEERNLIKNALLAISQIEVSVKKFWTKLGDRFPKPEFEQVGVTFGESEVRHSDAYSHLLQVLGLNDDFSILLDNPIVQGRVEYLTKYLKGAADNSDQNYTLTLALFALFIENVSLFSQFLIIKSFNKYKNLLKDVDNVVQATAKEEAIHALFGVELIKIIKKEHPEWFDDEFYSKIYRACNKAYHAEAQIVEWIFDGKDFEFITRHTVKEFIKKRFNDSLAMIGAEGSTFVVDEEALKEVKWFDEEILAKNHIDFFHKKSTNYSKKTQSYSEEDLF